MIKLAPSSRGFSSHGVLNVQSSISGMPAEAAILAIASTSIISSPGLPITSPKITLVFGWIAFSIPAKSFGSMKLVVMPKRGSVFSNKLMLAPYIRDDATI